VTGTRVALGATRADILWMIMRQGSGTAVSGLGLGVVAGLFLSRGLRTTLFSVLPADPWTLARALALLGMTVVAACNLPARRAASVHPARALEHS
jgi:putative ABC transport system permease protein